MRKLFKNEIGITLVALVVTIIILLILASISIATLTGSGLFKNARLAEQKYQNAQEKENGILDDYQNIIDNYLSEGNNLKAEEIGFTPEDSSWNVKNVKEALDYLYKN